MVQSNKVTPAVQDLQGVNILGSWTLTDTAMVRLNRELEDRRLTMFLSFLEPRLSIAGTRKSPSTTITRKLQTPDPVKVRESPRKIKTLSNSPGNFSQLIWRASKTLGVGYGRFVSIFEDWVLKRDQILRDPMSGRVVVVAVYDPPGNVEGCFAANVPPSSKNISTC